MKFPLYWKTIPLGDAGRWQGGSTPSKGHLAYWTDGTIPWVSPKDMKAQRIVASQDNITEAALDNTSLKLLPVGAILFVTRSGILARTLPIAETSVEVAINQDIKALVLKPEFYPEFVRHQLSFREQEILSVALKLGTTVQSVDFSALKFIQLYYPPLAEQRQIAASLSNLQRRIDLLQVRLDDIITLVDVVRRKVIETGFKSGVMQTEPDEKRGWNSTTLEEIAEIRSGITLGKRYDETEVLEVPYVRVANVQRGHLALEDMKTIRIPTGDAERYRLQPGDILMNEGGDRDKLGRGWVWEGQIEECVHQNHVFCVRLFDKSFPPEYISMYVNEFGRDFFIREGTQTTNLASISKSKLGKFPLSIPDAAVAELIITEVLGRLSELQGISKRVISLKSQLRRIEYEAFSSIFSGMVSYRVPIGSGKSLVEIEHNKSKNFSKEIKAKKMKATLSDLLLQWPQNGLTFESLWEKVPLEYDQIKESLFVLLSGDSPTLIQTFDKDQNAMILHKAKL
jgi:type I restriction enzyme S subunit